GHVRNRAQWPKQLELVGQAPVGPIGLDTGLSSLGARRRMRRPVVFASGVLLAASLAGCSGDDAMARQQIALMNEMAAALENITDIPSLKEADAKLTALRQKLVRLQIQTKDWSEGRKNAIKERFKSELDAAIDRFQQAVKKAKSKAEEL